MPILLKYLAKFEENSIYHIYNRTNNKELLFLNDDNRIFFLKRYKEFLSPVTDTYCWCLQSNHFHLLIKVKSDRNIRSFLKNKPDNELTITEKHFIAGKKVINELLVHTFKRFFQSYALAFNKMHNRNGNLFYKPFKRIAIENDTQFTMAMVYIHSNAVKHGLVKDFADYLWSSWHSILSDKPTLLAREEVIDWFGSLELCIKAHYELANYYYDCEVGLEE